MPVQLPVQREGYSTRALSIRISLGIMTFLCNLQRIGGNEHPLQRLLQRLSLLFQAAVVPPALVSAWKMQLTEPKGICSFGI